MAFLQTYTPQKQEFTHLGTENSRNLVVLLALWRTKKRIAVNSPLQRRPLGCGRPPRSALTTRRCSPLLHSKTRADGACPTGGSVHTSWGWDFLTYVVVIIVIVVVATTVAEAAGVTLVVVLLLIVLMVLAMTMTKAMGLLVLVMALETLAMVLVQAVVLVPLLTVLTGLVVLVVGDTLNTKRETSLLSRAGSNCELESRLWHGWVLLSPRRKKSLLFNTWKSKTKKLGCWNYSSLEGVKKWETKFDREDALLRVNGVRCKKKCAFHMDRAQWNSIQALVDERKNKKLAQDNSKRRKKKLD